MALKLSGALAALLTPRTAVGDIDWEAAGRLSEFTAERGVAGLVVAGATGEYASLAPAERGRLTEIAVRTAKPRGLPVLCGCGSSRLTDSVASAEAAFAAGAAAVLLPPPSFFEYSQEDLEGYYLEAAKRIEGPILVYNLPLFVTPMQPATIVRLLRAAPNLVGVKDSSGDLHVLDALTDRPELEAVRVLGHDRILAAALRGNLLDAVISGLAGAVPEAIVAVFDASETGDDVRFEALIELIDELGERVSAVPYPWVLTEIASARGLCEASFPFPPSDSRRSALNALREWLPTWLDRLSTVNISRRV